MVAGGGPAGIAAALAARSQGARVLLIESQQCLGGMGTSGGLPLLCHFTDGVNFIAGGVGKQVYTRLIESGKIAPFVKNGDQDLYFSPEALKYIYDQLAVEAGVDLLFGTKLLSVESEQSRVTYAICAGKGGMFAVKAGCYVDATGDGDLCAMAGAEFEKGDSEGRMQPGTLASYWANIDWQKAADAGVDTWKQKKYLAKAMEDGVFSIKDSGMPGIIQNGLHTGNGNIGHLFGIDGTDDESLTQGALLGRRQVYEYEKYYKEYLSGYEDMELICTAATVGIRESRRIMGDYILNAEDYHTRAVFDDEIGRFCYGIDLHPTTPQEVPDNSFENSFMKKGESYGVPYRILTPKGLDNVLVTGRCVSSDRAINGSIRVMPGCYITGQAAGMAAAITASACTTIRDINVRELQKSLLDFGAYLPNFA